MLRTLLFWPVLVISTPFNLFRAAPKPIDWKVHEILIGVSPFAEHCISAESPKKFWSPNENGRT